jgi:hypothetical protein
MPSVGEVDASWVSSIGGQLLPGNYSLHVQVDDCDIGVFTITCTPGEFNVTVKLVDMGPQLA